MPKGPAPWLTKGDIFASLIVNVPTALDKNSEQYRLAQEQRELISQTITFVFAMYGNPTAITPKQWREAATLPDDRTVH